MRYCDLKSDIMRSLVRQCRPFWLTALKFSAFINVLYLAPTLYMMQVYDRVVPTSGTGTLLVLTLVLGLAIATLSALDALRSRILHRASYSLNERISPTLFRAIIEITNGETASMERRTYVMQKVEAIRQAVTGMSAVALMDLPWTPIYFAAAFLLHPLLGAFILVGCGTLVAVGYLTHQVSAAQIRKAQEASVAAQGFHDAISRDAELIRAFGMTSSLVRRQTLIRSVQVRRDVEGQLQHSFLSGTSRFLRMFFQSLALGIGAWLAINGKISAGSIIAASVLLSRAMQPVEQLISSWPVLVRGIAAVQFLDDYLGNAVNEEDKVALPRAEGSLDVEGVSYAKDSSEGPVSILSDVTLSVPKGKVTCLIGASGAGKSTLARLCAGAIAPSEGCIRLDGANYVDWQAEYLAGQIGYLPQEPVLFPGTVAENISRFSLDDPANSEDTQKAIIDVAKQVGIHEAILRLPQGYNTRVGTDAFNLSGGQKQRLGIARALFGDPQMIVMDEPTNALDGNGYNGLMSLLVSLRKAGRAILIVSHNSAMISLSDYLVVLDGGKIARQGPQSDVVREMTATPAGAPRSTQAMGGSQ